MPAWARRRTVGACLAAFGLLGILVAMGGPVPELDAAMEDWLAESIGPGARAAFLWVSVLGSLPVAIVAVLATMIACERLGSRRNALLMLAAIVLDVAVRALKIAFDVPRPDSVDPGYPSGHTARGVGVLGMGMFLVYASWRAQKAGRPPLPWWPIASWLTLGVVTGAARVLGGVHWLSDVVGGFLLGLAFAMASNHYAQRAPGPTTAPRPMPLR